MSKKKWYVPVSWRMFKTMEVEAETKEQAGTIAFLSGDTQNGEYSKGSFEVDADDIEEAGPYMRS